MTLRGNSREDLWLGQLRSIQERVCKEFSVTRSDLVSKRRHKELMPARHAAMWLCRNLTRASFPMIGRSFDGKDHTTIMHGVNCASDMMSSDKDYDKKINRIYTEHLLVMSRI